MRIIAGCRRGAQLFAPSGMDTRPTQDRVKESLFNILQAQLADAKVLDLFAGSGALGLEAISRGASFAALVDSDREAIRCIRRNVEKLRFEEATRIYACDWHQALSKLRTDQQRFDLVFLDPPYRMTEVYDGCGALADAGLLEDGAMLVMEHKAGFEPKPDARFTLADHRTYRDTEIHFYVYEQEGKA